MGHGGQVGWMAREDLTSRARIRGLRSPLVDWDRIGIGSGRAWLLGEGDGLVGEVDRRKARGWVCMDHSIGMVNGICDGGVGEELIGRVWELGVGGELGVLRDAVDIHVHRMAGVEDPIRGKLPKASCSSW